MWNGYPSRQRMFYIILTIPTQSSRFGCQACPHLERDRTSKLLITSMLLETGFARRPQLARECRWDVRGIEHRENITEYKEDK
jgi:hypothetical protein